MFVCLRRDGSRASLSEDIIVWRFSMYLDTIYCKWSIDCVLHQMLKYLQIWTSDEI